MRKSISAVAAIAIAATSIVAAMPANATTKTPPQAGSDGLQLVGNWRSDGPVRGGRDWGGGWHNRWDNDGWRHRRHHRHHRSHVDPFFFALPFAFAPQPRYRHDCYRGWDGRLYCAR